MQNSYFTVGAWPWKHRDLIWQFCRRDVLSRYRGSWLGMGWAVLTPLLMLTIYTTVFRSVAAQLRYLSAWSQSTGFLGPDGLMAFIAGVLPRRCASFLTIAIGNFQTADHSHLNAKCYCTGSKHAISMNGLI
jgi:ABC-type polysaccharide/polyol phosphate export permease